MYKNLSTPDKEFLYFAHAMLNRLTPPLITAIDLWMFWAKLNKGNTDVVRRKIKQLFSELPTLRYSVQTSVKYLQTQWNKRSRYIQEAHHHLKELNANGISALFINSTPYPKPLKQLWFPPLILYVRGSLPKTDTPSVAVVGTRNPSWEAISKSLEILPRFLKKRKIALLVSGRAKGSDSLALYIASKLNLPAISVLAQLQTEYMYYYPTEIWVSEYLVAPDWSFKRRLVFRNRIIAAWGEELIILQAPARSGALITARFAMLHNKPIRIVKPSRVTYATAGGVYIRRNYRHARWLTV